MAEKKKIALVTGANRGLGFEISRQLAKQGIYVVMGSRKEALGKKAAAQLKDEGLDVESAVLDVTDDKTIKQTVARVIKDHGRIDILVNNAGIMIDWGNSGERLKISDVQKTLDTNMYGALRLIQAVLPYMKKNGYGRIVNQSSTLGSLDFISNGGGTSAPSYCLSKAALNAITALYASDLGRGNIKINSASPGWVRTRMGGDSAPRSPEEGADTAVWLATLPKNGPSGGFFKDRKPIAW